MIFQNPQWSWISEKDPSTAKRSRLSPGKPNDVVSFSVCEKTGKLNKTIDSIKDVKNLFFMALLFLNLLSKFTKYILSY